MTFLAPSRLVLLILVAVVIAGYIAVQRRRKHYALRFSSSELFDSIPDAGPGWRRHVPPLFFLAAVTLLTAAVAQPARQVRVPRERATVIVAIDVSLSMQADDVEPDRINAAQQAAIRFIDELPPTLNVGIVSFAGTASVLVSPTVERLPARNAINNLRLAESTAIGEAIFTSLEALRNAPPDETGEAPPARIVLLSDGKTTIGRPDASAVAAAREAEVPVSTIAFGTAGGFVVLDDPQTPQVEQQRTPVPVEENNLRDIADSTGGAFFTASSLGELEEVYDNIGSAVGYELVDREVTDWFAAAALALLLLSGALSLLWFSRLP